MSELLHFFASDFMLRNALWGTLAVGLFCPLIGTFFMMRRMVLLGVALPQVSACGIALAFWLQAAGIHWSLHAGEADDRFFALILSLGLTGLALLVLGWLERKGDTFSQSRTGAVYVAAYAAALLLVSANPNGETQFLGMLQGEIVAVSAHDLHILLAVYAGVSLLMVLFHRHFVLVSFDRDFAAAQGRAVAAWDIALYALIGVTVSVSVVIVGPMPAFAALVIPPFIARRHTRSMRAFTALSILLGGFGALAGFWFSYHYDLPLGPCMIASLAALAAPSSLVSLASGRRSAAA